MQWAAAAAIISGLTLLIVLIGGGSLWGTLTERVAAHSRDIEVLKGEHSLLHDRVNTQDVEIGKLKEWKNGYNAAASVGRRTPEV